MTEDEITDPTTRVCRRCSTRSAAAGQFCPACGASYTRRGRRPSRRVMAVGAAGVLLVAAVAGGLAVKGHRDATARDDRATAARAAADERAEQTEAAQAEADTAERESRESTVEYLEEQITKDAKDNVADGLLDGPIKFTQCTATGGGSTDDLTALTGTFECLVANKENDDGTIEGYAYSGTAEWETGSISWHLGR